jgi:hypothetical protein
MKKNVKKKKKTVKKLKETCWIHCSIYNRRKDADWRGYVVCCTCGDVRQWDEVDAGHFLGGRTNGILFDDRGIHAQCKRCNGFRGGEQAKYEKFMLKRYGQKVVDELYKLRDGNKTFSEKELEEKIETYKNLILSL